MDGSRVVNGTVLFLCTASSKAYHVYSSPETVAKIIAYVICDCVPKERLLKKSHVIFMISSIIKPRSKESPSCQECSVVSGPAPRTPVRSQLLHSSNVCALNMILILLDLGLEIFQGNLLVLDDHIDLQLLDTEANRNKLMSTPYEAV